jgi:hypothetical protein
VSGFSSTSWFLLGLSVLSPDLATVEENLLGRTVESSGRPMDWNGGGVLTQT